MSQNIESVLAPLGIDKRVIERIYPLNKLDNEALSKLRSDMRLWRVRANQFLYRAGEAPSESYWVIDGVVQLSDAAETRLETVSMTDSDVAVPLPHIVPANESARALVDCTILCVDRNSMTKLMHLNQIEPLERDDSASSLNQSDEELFRQFEQARGVQQDAHHGAAPRALEADDDPAVIDPFANAVGEENRRSHVVHLPTRRVPRVDQAEYTAAREALSVKKTMGPEDVRSALAAFATLPGFERLDLALRVECLQQCEMVDFAPSQHVETPPGEDDAWHLVMIGECKVLFADGDKTLEINRHGPGMSFGEDNLILGHSTRTSVEALNYVRAVRLPSRAFRRLLLPPMVKQIDAQGLEHPSFEQATWIDVRLPSERDERRIIDAVEIPWPVISAYPFGDNPGSRCVVVGDSGKAAELVTFELRKYGFDAFALAGGMDQVPNSRITSDPDAGRSPDILIRIQ